MKTCRGCGETKPLEAFSPERRVRDGRKSRCKPCLAVQARGREAYFRAHYRKNRARRLAWMRNHYDRAAYQRRRREDPRCRLDDAMGMQLSYALRHHKRRRPWTLVVGYTLSELITHLSALFRPGMTMANYGAWHVDHIIPRSKFSYRSETDEQFRRCWALSNLQPLWAAENMAKGARVA